MMNALPEMLNGTDISVLQRQRARMKWQQDQQQQHQLQQNQQLFWSENDQFNVFSVAATQPQQFQHLGHFDSGFGRILSRAVKPDPGMDNRWLDYGKYGGGELFGYGACGYDNVNGIELNSEFSRTVSCPPAVVEAIKEASSSHSKGMEQISCGVGSDSIKKRKTDKTPNQKVTEVEGIKEEKVKGCAEDGDSKITTDQNNNNKKTANINNDNNRATSSDASIDKSKITEVQKTDYIHVRARRGQATDSHSLAERVRREKFSERMKYLQDLVPGCNKITGKAGMLDEIINYVQSLQRQVEFLSVKLAAVNPTPNISIDNFFTKEMFQASPSNFHTNEFSTETANPAYFQFNPLQQVDTNCGLDLEINHPDMAHKRTISAPAFITETFVDSFCYNHVHPPVSWDAELQNLYNAEIQQGRSTSYPSQSFTAGPSEGNNLKMEM